MLTVSLLHIHALCRFHTEKCLASVVLSAIKRYVNTANESIRDVKAVVDENRKRLLDLDQQAQVHHKKNKTWQAAASNDISTLTHNFEAHNNAALMQHTETNENIREVGTEILGHNQGWKEEVKRKEQGKVPWPFSTCHDRCTDISIGQIPIDFHNVLCAFILDQFSNLVEGSNLIS